MVIRLFFPDDLIRSFDHRGMTPPIGIYCEHDGACYPDEAWVDSGTIVLGWWLSAVDRLQSGSPGEELSFMEEPYALQVVREGTLASIALRGSSIRWTTTPAALVEAVVAASKLVVERLDRLDVAASERAMLRGGIGALSLTHPH